MNATLKQTLCQIADESYEHDADDRTEWWANKSLGYGAGDHLGTGEYRYVHKREIDGVTYAIKFAKSTEKLYTNRKEFRLYRQSRGRLRDILARPIEMSTCGRVIAFEFIPETLTQHASSSSTSGDYEEVTSKKYAMEEEFRDTLNEILLEAGFSHDEIYEMCLDNHGSNIGVREDGSMVWIDYACY